MEDNRPDPDALLQEIMEEENKTTGRLKIFFGFAAGVGKTYAMLSAAHSAQRAGIKVAVGYIEPHTRPETLALLDGLTILPNKEIQYKGITLRELDLDNALKSGYQLILVDELAHTNGEGSRHRKRYQDIEELLKAGIDVYTTVNVQHLESLNDIVASITGVIVAERIPDSVFDKADQVELMDIEPEELLERLKLGKIYKQNQAARAIENFFVVDNLIALREIALRRTADRVNRRGEKKLKAINKQGYYTEEHILICLSGSPSNAKVIRTAARMVDAFHGMFTALYVETGKAAEQNVKNNQRLAEQLGARIATVYGQDVSVQIAEYAKISGVSKIVIGRANNKKRLIANGKSLVEQLTELAPNIDIYIIPDNQALYHKKRKQFEILPSISWRDTAKMAIVLCATTGLGIAFDCLGFTEANIITVYILGGLFISLITSGKIYGAISAVFNVLAFNFFFTTPRYSLQAYDTGYLITFPVMFLASFITSTLTMRIKTQAKHASQKAHSTEVLLETSQKLQRAKGEKEILHEGAVQIQKLLGHTVLMYPVENQKLSEPMYYPKQHENHEEAYFASLDEKAVAQWVYKNNKHAGATTNTLPGAKCLYMAVRNHDLALSVVGIALDNHDEIESFDKNLLVAILGECALALEKEQLGRAKNKIAMEAQQEQLRANLLRAISHDLRTPLTSISGNAGVLMGNSGVLDEEKKQQLYTYIFDDSMWLINLVENLLYVTRIENGSMRIVSEAEFVSEIIDEALRHLSRRSVEHVITVDVADDMLMALMDSRLIIQVLINIINNAIKYTAENSTISISAFRQKNMVHIEIADDGEGIDDEAKKRLFDMFYTAENNKGDGRRGLGLGLPLCKSIISAHGGDISVRDGQSIGTVFAFTLQAQEAKYYE